MTDASMQVLLLVAAIAGVTIGIYRLLHYRLVGIVYASVGSWAFLGVAAWFVFDGITGR